jgi:L-ascorbate metabolism protein UlaG (beta-lactamase superfamily)
MNIQYYGDYCFKISTKPAGRATDDVIIWTDPLEKGSGLRAPQGEADIVFLTHGDAIAARESLKGSPVVLDAPGEYAAKGIAALGFPSFRDGQGGAERGQNSIFVFESEDIHVCFLGAVGHDLSPELLDKLNGVDILFIPVGGSDTLSAKVAAEMVRKIEPNIVIPMHYRIPGLTLPLDTEKAFCEAIGSCPKETLPRLNIKKKDLEEKMLEVVLLERGA